MAPVVWLGCFDEVGLCGAVAWQVLDEASTSPIPAGIRMIVSTGRPERTGRCPTLYRRRGFRPVGRREAAPGLLVTELAPADHRR